MILDEDAHYCTVNFHGVLEVGDSLVAWPPFNQPKKLRTIFRVISPLYKNRKIHIQGDFEVSKGVFQTVDVYVWLDAISLFRLSDIAALQQKWRKEDEAKKLKGSNTSKKDGAKYEEDFQDDD